MLNDKIFHKVILTLFLVFSPFLYSMAGAQETKLVISTDTFSENYTGSANVSSAGILVGLAIGANPIWSVSNVTVALPKKTPTRLCLRTSSLDGRFWSENPYLPPSGTSAASLGPLTEQYTKVLKTMTNDQLAFRISAPSAKGCRDLSTAQFFPVLGGGAKELVVHINSGDRRVVTRLSRAGKAISSNVECLPIKNTARVAADRKCIIPLLGISGQADLQLALIGMTGKAEKMSFNIYIPPYISKP